MEHRKSGIHGVRVIIPAWAALAARIQSTAVGLAGVAAALALAFQVASAAAGGPEIANFTLQNGLEVVVIPDHRTPVVTHMIWYKVGSADETPGKSGLAHFLEHLMFKGTAKNPAGRFSQTLATIGGQENAFTTADYTAYFQRIAKEYLPLVMEFEADRMTGLVLTDDNVLPERDVVLEEFNMRVANSPEARIGEQVAAALYLNHPYGRPVIGWRQEIEKLNRDDALAFYRRFYTPNNAVVVIAGDVNGDEVKALAEKTYGQVARVADVAPRLRPQEPLPVAVRQLTMADARVAQPTLQRNYLVPSANTAEPGESEALDVLSQILGAGETSRLYRALVVDEHVATGAGSWYQGTALDESRFGVFASPLPGVSFATLEAAIDGVIARIAESGVTAAEFERAKTRLIADAVYAGDNQATMARWYGAALTVGGSVEKVTSWPARVRAVTPEAVQKAARVWLDKRRSVTGYLVKELPGNEEKRS
ncbi:MAG TPA: pitrilysin family protein [Xanthobacteraceae bacterium]|nr:pitrilysin family protein [Xanthobacteraceae bacterium]